MNLVSGIIDSGFFAQSALSAEVATKDSLGRNISETYLTGIPANYATTNYVDSSVSGKYDTSSFSAISGEFLTTADSSEFYPMSGNPSGFLTGETDWTDTITAASAYAYSEATALIPTALTGDYIETSAMKSAQVGTTAFITGFYDGQISATFAIDANKAISAMKADSAAEAGSAHSASYVYSGWGATPTLHTDSAIKQYYAVTGSVQGFPAGILYKFNAYSADSASVAASAEKAYKDNLGNIIAMTYLTAHQPISATEWNSVYETVSDNSAGWTGGGGGTTGDYISAKGFDQRISNAAGTRFLSFYNEAGAGTPTATPAIYLSGEFGSAYYKENELKLGRNNHTIAFNIGGTGPKISAGATGSVESYMMVYNDNNSAIISQTGLYLKNSTATETANIASIQKWNTTTDTVSSNSGAWGGLGLEISAGFGIDIQMVDNKLVISLATATGDI